MTFSCPADCATRTNDAPRATALDAALASIRERFGPDAIVTGAGATEPLPKAPVVIAAPRELTEREQALKANFALHVSRNVLSFQPWDGRCFTCGGDVVAHVGAETYSRTILTGCPICRASWCE